MRSSLTTAALALLLGAPLLAFAGCTNDYDKFSQDSFSLPDGPGGAASGGASSGGASGSGASGSNSTGGRSGSGGVPTTPEECSGGQLDCGGQCTDVRSDERCGGCDNDCTAQGLVCAAGSCGCTNDDQCGGSGSCLDLLGRCRCESGVCRPGETCSGGACACNDGAACEQGETCCQSPAGCARLDSDPDNCGGCGLRCGLSQTCVAGVCQ
jgi:hypothetical protein